jgi:hypothetical protein
MPLVTDTDHAETDTTLALNILGQLVLMFFNKQIARSVCVDFD